MEFSGWEGGFQWLSFRPYVAHLWVEKLVQTVDWYTAGFQVSYRKMPIREIVDGTIFSVNTGPERTFDYFSFFFFLIRFTIGDNYLQLSPWLSAHHTESVL